MTSPDFGGGGTLDLMVAALASAEGIAFDCGGGAPLTCFGAGFKLDVALMSGLDCCPLLGTVAVDVEVLEVADPVTVGVSLTGLIGLFECNGMPVPDMIPWLVKSCE